MKRLILVLQVLFLALILTGLNSENVQALEYNRTVSIFNMFDNGDFSTDDEFLPESTYACGAGMYWTCYDPPADTVLVGGWSTAWLGSFGGDRNIQSPLTIIDEVAIAPGQSNEGNTIRNDFFEEEFYFGHIYYASVLTFTDSGSGAHSWSYTIHDHTVYVSSYEGVPTGELQRFSGRFGSVGNETNLGVNVRYSSYCQYGCPMNTPIYADNFMLFDLTKSFGFGKEPTAEEFEALLALNNAPEYITGMTLTFFDTDSEGDIKELNTLISADYEEYTYDSVYESTFGEADHIDSFPIINTVYGRTIPALYNSIYDYREDFYIKAYRTYYDTINSTYGESFTPLDSVSLLNQVYGRTIPQLTNLIDNGDFSDTTSTQVNTRNLLDFNAWTDATATFTDNKIVITNTYGNYIDSQDILTILDASTTYNISFDYDIITGTHSGSTGLWALRNPTTTDWFYLTGGGITDGENHSNFFTTPSNIADYTQLYLYGLAIGEVQFSNIQIELGDTKTDYIAYEITVDYPDNWYLGASILTDGVIDGELNTISKNPLNTGSNWIYSGIVFNTENEDHIFYHSFYYEVDDLFDINEYLQVSTGHYQFIPDQRIELNEIYDGASDIHSGIFTLDTNYTGNFTVGIGDNLENRMIFDNFMLFDLTLLFGSGNEPTLEEFEDILDYYTVDGYLQETTSIDYIEDFEIQSIGVNLFDEELEQGNISTVTGNNLVQTNVIRTLDFIRILPSQSYTLSVDSGMWILSIFEYDINQNFIDDTSGGSSDEKTITTTSETAYVRFTFITTGGATDPTIPNDLSWSQLEQGSVATDYVAYNSSSQILTADLLSVGDIRDFAYYDDDDEVWYKDQYVGYDETVVEVSDTWSLYIDLGVQVDTTAFEIDLFSLLDYKGVSSSSIANAYMIIDGIVYPAVSATGIYTNDVISFSIDDSDNFRIRTLDSNLTTVDVAGFEAWLNALEVELIYELETPILEIEIVSIGSLIQESVTTLIQQNNIPTQVNIHFIYDLDLTDTNYYYDESDSLLFNLLDLYGIGNVPTNEYFAETLDYIDQGGYFEEYLGFDYIDDFSIQTIGVNLFDGELESGKYTTSGTKVDESSTVRSVNYINITGDTRYSITIDLTSDTFIYYDKDYQFISIVTDLSQNTPSNARYLTFYYTEILLTDEIIINEGSDLLDYVEYNSASLGLEVDLFAIGGVQDIAYSQNEDIEILDNEVWYKDQYVGRDYNDVVQSAGFTWLVVFSTDLSSVLSNMELPSDNSVVPNINFIVGTDVYTATSINSLENDYEFAISTGGIISIYNSNYAGATAFEAYLQANDVTFIYELDTPILGIEVVSAGSLIQESLTTLIQSGLPAEYDIDIMVEEPYVSLWLYEQLITDNPFYQYDDYTLTDDEALIELSLKETLYTSIDTYPQIYIVKYDIDGNYVADIYSSFIYDFTIVDTLRNYTFEYTLPITSASENMYMWIAYNGEGGAVMGSGYVASETSQGFNTLVTGIRTLDYAIGVNDSVYLNFSDTYQYDHTTLDYITNSDDPIVVVHFRHDSTDDPDIIFYNENTEDTYIYDLETIESDFSSEQIGTYKSEVSYVVFSTSNELLGSMEYLLGLNSANDFIDDLDELMLDYVDIFGGYSDLGVFTYNIVNGVIVKAKGEAPIFYGDNPYIIDVQNSSVRYGNVVTVKVYKTSENFDNEYLNYYIFDSNSTEYFTEELDTFALENTIRYLLYEGLNTDEATVTFKAESIDSYLNGTDGSDYYILLSDTYGLRGVVNLQVSVDNWLNSVGLIDSTAKMLIAVIVIIGFTILLAVLKANFVTILIADFGVIGLLAMLGFIPVWIILFIVIIVMVLIFFSRRE